MALSLRIGPEACRQRGAWIVGRPSSMAYAVVSDAGRRVLLSAWAGKKASNGAIGDDHAARAEFLAWASDVGLLSAEHRAPSAGRGSGFRGSAGEFWGTTVDAQPGIGRYVRQSSLYSEPAKGSQRILVTGGLGELGSLLVPHLLRAGHTVTVVDKRAVRAGGTRLRTVECDIRDTHCLTQAMEGCDSVIHLAAIKGPRFGDDVREAWSVNVVGTETVVGACNAAGVQRLIYASSVSVHEQAGGVIDQGGATVPPRDAYGRSKWEAERHVATFAGRSRIYRIAQTVHVDIPWRPRTWEFTADQKVEYVDGVHVVEALSGCSDDWQSKRAVRIVSGGPAWRLHGDALANAFARSLPGERAGFSASPCPGVGWYEDGNQVSESRTPPRRFFASLRGMLRARALDAMEELWKRED